VALWDIRNLKQRLYSFDFHRDEVMQVQWSPHKGPMFASAGKDRRVMVWNMENISQSPTSVNAANSIGNGHSEADDDAPPEVQFLHGGHTYPINDISWNPHEIGMMASVSEDNILQVRSQSILIGINGIIVNQR
jgi:histone-binding protein RBBP4